MYKESVTRLPELCTPELEQLMEERISAAKNEKTVIPMLWQGLLELPVAADGKERTAKYYVPKDTPQGTETVILNVPDGETTLSFLEKSGWMRLADEKGFCLFVAEPRESGWGTPTEEEAYLRAAVSAAKLGRHLLIAFAPYIVGYGPIGTVLHRIAMEDPLHTAAAVFVEAGAVENDFREAYEKKDYVKEDDFNPSGETLKVPYREIPIPVWIISEHMDAQTAAMIDYWKNASGANLPYKSDPQTTIYKQNRPSCFTPEGEILTVAVTSEKSDPCSEFLTRLIYDFLNQYYRYGMGPKSNMISRKIDFSTIGADHHRFTDRNGIDHEYLVYVPKTFRNGHEKLPVVLAYHGASQSMRNMMANGLWYHIADENGLIIVYPESGLQPMPEELGGNLGFAYRPLWSLFDVADPSVEIDYADELLDRVIAEYPVDESRVYCTGHSMGHMMTNYLGSSVFSHRLAAVGATSGCLRTRAAGGTQSVPAFMTIGQYDLWSYLITEDTDVTAQLDMWLIRNGLASEENVREIRTSGASEVYKEGRCNNYVWKDANGIPWVRYAWLSDKFHVHSAEESKIFWEQWFSRWRLEENGRRIYHP